jgi:hypothetical protein
VAAGTGVEHIIAMAEQAALAGVFVAQDSMREEMATDSPHPERCPPGLTETQVERIRANREKAQKLRADRDRVRQSRRAAGAEAAVTEMSAGVLTDRAAETGPAPLSAGVPTDAADPATTTGPRSGAAQEGPTCVICQERLMSEQSRLAMPCGHAFHEECVRRYAECKQIPLREACPMRCHRSSISLHVPMEEMPSEPGRTADDRADEFHDLVAGALQNAAGVM